MYFVIRLVKKPKTHEYYQEGSDYCYTVNQVITPILLLERNKEYTFDVDTEGHPFIFTLSFEGGSLDYSFSTPFDKGKLTFTVPKEFPNTGFYQCANHKYMGGKFKLIN